MNPNDANILVVEDDESLREVIVYEFERNKFKVLSASNGTEAIEIVKTNNIHIVLSDIRMPGGDGIDLLKKIRAINPLIPVVIFISGFSDFSTKEAIALGARKIFEKPFNRTDVFAEVLKALTEINPVT